MIRHVLAACVAAAGAACTAAPDPAEPLATPVRVTVQAAALRAMPQSLEAGGIVRARTTAAVASRILAPVRLMAVAAGDRVKAGQTLVTLDGRDLDANDARAAAAVTALERGVASAVANRDAASSALTLARLTHGRIAALHARRSATAQELDEATAALHTAEAQAAGAEARVAETTASLESARAAASAARVTASFAVVTAPFDGLVTETLVEQGNLASPGMPLLRIEDTRSFRLEVHVDESEVVHVGRGRVVEVVARGAMAGNGAPETIVNGRVSEVARAVDAASHAFLVKIDLGPHAALRSGMFARARLTAGSRDVLAVPRAAIVPQGQLSTAFVSDNGRAQMRVLSTGQSAGEWVDVLAGIAPGELVIVSPPPSLRDGDAVAAAHIAGSAP
jgi:RND family efflux transporter MFP subunit